MWNSQYGLPSDFRFPQKWKSRPAGSPNGQRQSSGISVATVFRSPIGIFRSSSNWSGIGRRLFSIMINILHYACRLDAAHNHQAQGGPTLVIARRTVVLGKCCRASNRGAANFGQKRRYDCLSQSVTEKRYSSHSTILLTSLVSAHRLGYDEEHLVFAVFGPVADGNVDARI
jgi:hypothetical protein